MRHVYERHETKNDRIEMCVFYGLTVSILVILSNPLIIGHASLVDNPRVVAWAHSYGGSSLDVFYSVQQTFDGGYVAAGETGSFGDNNNWVVRLDASGNMLWQFVYGNDQCASSVIRQMPDGGFIVAGGSCITKLDPAGNVVWSRDYGGAGTDEIVSLDRVTGGGFIVAGETRYVSNTPPDAFLLCLDASGNPLWQKTYGGPGTDVIISVKQVSDGGFIAAGETNSYGAGDFDAWIIRLDQAGSVLWQETIGGPGTDRITSIIQTSDLSFYAVGGTNSLGAGGFDAWALGISSTGSVLWQKTYGGSGPDQFTAVEQSFDGEFIATGEVEGNAGFVKLDQLGNVIWQTTFGGSEPDFMFAVQQTSDGGFIGAGITKSFGVPDPELSGDAWLLKLDTRGNIPGMCQRRSQFDLAVMSSNLSVTPTFASTIDTATSTTSLVTPVTVSSATIGTQCIPTSRRP